jgi:hypothetical protein
MKKFKIIFLVTVSLISLFTIYVLFFMDNLFIHVTNYSREEKPVEIKCYISKTENETDRVLLFSKPIPFDSIGNLEIKIDKKIKRNTDYFFTIEVNNCHILNKELITFNHFGFVYITIDKNKGYETCQYDIASNFFDIKEAWDQNLILFRKE